MKRSCLPFLLLFLTLGATPPFPAEPRAIARLVTHEEMRTYLASVARPGLIQVTTEGVSAGGRELQLVHLNRGGAKAKHRVFLYAQQHGNEASGKEALLYLIRRFTEQPHLLPETLDLWILPCLNPDGMVAGKRTNGAGADLNRDHLLLTQPETQVLHRLVQRLMPHLTVDLHEYSTDHEDFGRLGWKEWATIKMDALNHPLMPHPLREAALRRVEDVAPAMAAAGHRYQRYNLFETAPDGEFRFSTLESDDGRNGLAAYGVLSFIIETGMARRARPLHQDLGSRIAANLALLDPFLMDEARLAGEVALVEEARKAPLPAFLPTNVFWGNVDGKIGTYRVIERATGRTLEIPNGNLMTDVVVKASVPRPAAYAILPAAAEAYRALLERSGIRFETLSAPRAQRTEACTLQRVEAERDEVYHRHAGRQIVQRKAAATEELPAGTLLVSLDQPFARRAVFLLEPCMLYGVYARPEFRALVDREGLVPVRRIL